MTSSDEIRNAVAHSLQMLEDRRFEDWVNSFTEDAVYDSYSAEIDAFRELHGRAAIRDWVLGAELNSLPELNRCFILANQVIEVKGETAVHTCDVIIMSQYESEAWSQRVGRYEDKLTRQNGRWLVARRRCVWRPRNTIADARRAGIAPTLDPKRYG
jgi:hypothetical protein